MKIVKSIFNIALKVLAWILVAFAVFMMIFTVFKVTTVDKNDRSIFGMKFYIVLSDSMSPSENNKDMDVHFSAGDIVIAQEVEDKTKFQKGDIISFVSRQEDSYGETVTHMIYDFEYDKDGKFVGYVTYGTNKPTENQKPETVDPDWILGVYKADIPMIGHFFNYMKSTPGYIVCILVPFLLLILYNGINVIRLFRQYKGEQMDAMKAERDKIDAERAENQRMMQELLALKAQLEQKSGEETPPSDNQ